MKILLLSVLLSSAIASTLASAEKSVGASVISNDESVTAVTDYGYKAPSGDVYEASFRNGTGLSGLFSAIASAIDNAGKSVGAPVISKDELVTAVTNCGYKPPPDDVYEAFRNATVDFSREEAALFLAQLIHESMSFKAVEEIACKETKCPNKYVDDVGLPGKYYYGRGYVQLTWGKNYKAASRDLGLGDQLLENPDLVASDKNIAMQVSRWYWVKNVRPRLARNPNSFGITTKAINASECKNFPERAQKRWKIYLKVVEALALDNKAEETGCYN